MLDKRLISRLSSAFAFCLLLVGALPANAVSLHATFSGTLSSPTYFSPSSSLSELTHLDPFTFTVDYDTDASPWLSLSNGRGYRPIAASLQAGGLHFDFDPALSSINVFTPFNGGTLAAFFGRSNISGIRTEFAVRLQAPLGYFDLLPPSAFDLSALTAATVEGSTADLNGLTGLVGGTLVSAQLASVSAVPLPGALWLFGSALLGWLGVTRRRSSSATPAPPATPAA